jgi:hypothetical protein
VRLRSKIAIDGTALLRESHDWELCPAHDDVNLLNLCDLPRLKHRYATLSCATLRDKRGLSEA